MTSRRSFLKLLGLSLGGATIASKAVSAILTLPEKKNELQRVPDTQNGHPDAWIDADYEHIYRIHPDMARYNWLEPYPLRLEYQGDGYLKMIETYPPPVFAIIRDK